MDTPWTWEKINAESNAVTAFHAALTQKNQLLTDPSLPYAAYQSLRAEVEREIEILTQRNDAVELQRKARQDADAAVFKGAVQRLSQINHQGDGVAPAGDEEAKPASPKVEGAHQGPNSQAVILTVDDRKSIPSSTQPISTVSVVSTAPPANHPAPTTPPAASRHGRTKEDFPQALAITDRPPPTLPHATGETLAPLQPPLNHTVAPTAVGKQHAVKSGFWLSEEQTTACGIPVIRMWRSLQDVYYKYYFKAQLALKALHSHSQHKPVGSAQLDRVFLREQKYRMECYNRYYAKAMDSVLLLEELWESLDAFSRSQLACLAPLYDLRRQLNSVTAKNPRYNVDELILQTLEADSHAQTTVQKLKDDKGALSDSSEHGSMESQDTADQSPANKRPRRTTTAQASSPVTRRQMQARGRGRGRK